MGSPLATVLANVLWVFCESKWLNEYYLKKVLLLLYCKQAFLPHTLLCYVVQIAFLNLLKST